MSNARRGHHPKSPQERQRYFDNVIRESGPTVEYSTISPDATDYAERASPDELTLSRPTPRNGWFARLWKDEPSKLILSSIGVVIVGLLGWGGLELYKFQREIAILTEKVSSLHITQQSLNNDLDRVESRIRSRLEDLSNDIERLETRIDRINERAANSSP